MHCSSLEARLSPSYWFLPNESLGSHVGPFDWERPQTLEMLGRLEGAPPFTLPSRCRWRQSSSMHTEFVPDALEQALYDRQQGRDGVSVW